MIKAKVTLNGTQMQVVRVNTETGEVTLAIDLDSEQVQADFSHSPRRAGKTTQYRAWRDMHNKTAPVVLADESHPVVIDKTEESE